MLFSTLHNTFNSLFASTKLRLDDQSMKTIADIQAFMKDFRSVAANVDDDHCILITENEVTTILNIITYNDYAKLYHKLGKAPTFDQYMFEENYLEQELPSISEDTWHAAYDFISDLFVDNKDNPCDPSSKFILNCNQLIKMVNHQ